MAKETKKIKVSDFLEQCLDAVLHKYNIERAARKNGKYTYAAMQHEMKRLFIRHNFNEEDTKDV